jgi:hypothetical protein
MDHHSHLLFLELNAERFFIYIFLHQKRKQCLEFALPKPGEICIHLAGAYNSNSNARGLHYLTFVCGKQAEKSTQLGKSFKGKMSQKSSSSSILIEFPNMPPKNHNLFCEIGLKKGGRRKRKICDH